MRIYGGQISLIGLAHSESEWFRNSVLYNDSKMGQTDAESVKGKEKHVTTKYIILFIICNLLKLNQLN